MASALGVRLRACTPGQRLNGLRRVVVAGDVQDLPLDPALELVVLAPCRMEDRNSHRLKGWIEPGPLPVFGEHRAFPESDRLPWRYRDGGCLHPEYEGWRRTSVLLPDGLRVSLWTPYVRPTRKGMVGRPRGSGKRRVWPTTIASPR